MILQDIIKNTDYKSQDYVQSMTKKFNEFKYISEIPPVYRNYSTVYDKLPNKLGTLFNNIYDIVSERYSYIFLFNNYDNTGKLCNCLIDEYFKYCIQNDKNIENILYLNTKLFVEDYTKLVAANNEGVKPVLSYRTDTRYQTVHIAPIILWDCFNKLETPYECKKLYDILLSRYMRGLGNIFIVDRDISTLQIYKKEMLNVMDIGAVIDCRQEVFVYKPDTNS